ncbi:aminoglycoside phosphotransferase family protein [Candidatus Bathyarchaeota archaeon]|nr:aminoglycoside phosphotransferase family protein [Candidatus Bathyarchaeota archaeon]
MATTESNQFKYPMIPRTITDVDDDWLTAAFQKSGIITTECKVVQVKPEKTGPGVAGSVHRISLSYTNGEGPQSAIVKLHSCDSFALQRFPNKLATESGFYRDIGDQSGVKVPQCYYNAFLPTEGSFCIIMEDVGKGIETISASIRFSEQQLFCLLSEIANMHAKWWQSTKLESLNWIRPLKTDADDRLKLLQSFIPEFIPKWSSELTPEMLELFKNLPELFKKATDYVMSSPRTLIHGDINPGNLVWNEAGEVLSLIILDWQDIIFGPAARDVSSILSYTKPESHSTAVTYYLDVLNKHGIEYSSERFQNELVACSLFGAFVAAGRGVLGTVEQDNACRRLIANRGYAWVQAAKLLG